MLGMLVRLWCKNLMKCFKAEAREMGKGMLLECWEPEAEQKRPGACRQAVEEERLGGSDGDKGFELPGKNSD